MKESEIRDSSLERKGERFASYKGVVINGTEGKREHDRRENQGKGKGKMYEEDESKWFKVPEKEFRRSSSNRDRVRRDDRETQLRGSGFVRKEEYGDRQRFSGARGMRRERSPREYFLYQERRSGKEDGSTGVEEKLDDRDVHQGSHQHETRNVILAKVHDYESSKNGLEKDAGEGVEEGLELVNEMLQDQDRASSNAHGPKLQSFPQWFHNNGVFK